MDRMIKGKLFRCTPFDWKAGAPLLLELMTIKGKVLGTIAGGAMTGGVDVSEALGGIFAEIPQAIMDHGGLDFFTRLLAGTVYKSGEIWVKVNSQEAQTVAFGNDYAMGFLVLGLALEANYAPFLMEVMTDMTGRLNSLLDKFGLTATVEPVPVPE